MSSSRHVLSASMAVMGALGFAATAAAQPTPHAGSSSFGTTVAIGPVDTPAAGVSTPEQLEAEARSYCDFVAAAAESESAIDKAPWLFAEGGVIPVHTLGGVPAADIGTPTAYPRILAGVGFSPTNFYRGVLGAQYARAECLRYRTALEIREIAAIDPESFSVSGWSAKLAVLDEAIPQGDAVVAKIKERVAVGQATTQDLDAAVIRLDALRELRAEARDHLAGLHAPTLVPSNLERLVASRADAEANIEKVESSLRRLAAFDLTMQGGYDRFLGTDQPFPFFGTVGLTFSLGWMVQGSPETRAAAARARWSADQTAREAGQARLAMEKLRALLDADAKRLRELEVLRADLEQRTQSIADLGALKAADYADYVWFDLARVRSEEAYLEAHVHALAAVVRAP
jgi:hypothetical protein